MPTKKIHYLIEPEHKHPMCKVSKWSSGMEKTSNQDDVTCLSCLRGMAYWFNDVSFYERLLK